ncbi:MAG: radical SAM protein [archaeon]
MLKTTKSLCPECLSVIEAKIENDEGRVVISKTCPQHGSFEDTYWSSHEQYARAEAYEWVGEGLENPRTQKVRGCPYDCGICPEHKSATVLAIIDITNRCNLTCPVCFANAAASGYVYEPTQQQIEQMLTNLRSNRPVAPVALQFSGGEPTLRDDLPELVSKAKQMGFHHVEVNTNGLKLSKSAEYIKNLMQAGVDTFYLQFDGLDDGIYTKIRGLPLMDVKLKAIEMAHKAGLDSMMLVPTLIKGVNDHQIGDMIRFAAKNRDVIRGINFQPVSICGRIDRAKLKEMRFTISDFTKCAEIQTEGAIKTTDFYPVPVVVPIAKAVGSLKHRRYSEFTSHQHCGVATFITTEGDKIVPITKYVDVDKFMKSMTDVYTLASAGKKIRAMLKLTAGTRHVKLGLLRGSIGNVLKGGSYDDLGRFVRKLVLVGAMHFMDPYNFDLARLQRCCIHYATPDGRIIPFCSMNSIHRPEVEKKLSVPLSEWKEKKSVAPEQTVKLTP